MKLDEIVAWYQKKIGTYDKQQWEKTVEQKILDGFSSVTLKTAKLKTEFIDVDLVRGSTFPKAKPKQSLLTVIRLAILRYLFLPLYAQWWVKQTSPNIFALLLFLYITQMVNWATYSFNINRPEQNVIGEATNSNSSGSGSNGLTNATLLQDDIQIEEGEAVAIKQFGEHIVSLSELIIPMALSLLLSLIHSQIVATNTASSSSKSKRRRVSNASQSGGCYKQARAGGGVGAGTSGEQRLRRRKKLVKIRSQDFLDTKSKLPSCVEALQKQPPPPPSHTHPHVPSSPTTSASAEVASQKTTCSSKAIVNQETFNTTSAITRHSNHNHAHTRPNYSLASCSGVAILKLDLNKPNATSNSISNSNPSSIAGHFGADPYLRLKRNVNWHSPIHNYAETQEKQQQTSPQAHSSSSSTTTNSSGTSSPNTAATGGSVKTGALVTGGVNSSSAGSSAATTPSKSVRIDDSVREFYDDLLNRTASTQPLAAINEPPTPALSRRPIGEDDGFESLNGKSSSGEETNSPPPTSSSASLLPSASGAAAAAATVGAAQPPVKNHLRLRINAADASVRSLEESQRKEVEKKSSSTASYRRKVPVSSESDYEKNLRANNPAAPTITCCDAYQQTKKPAKNRGNASSSDETDEEGDDGETVSSPASLGNNSNFNECTTSATEWLGVTTNSEECSYSSDLDNSDYKNHHRSDEDGYDLDYTPTVILNAHGTDRISCTIWDQREIKKAQLSVLEISSCIIERVESMPETNDYIYIGICFSILLSLIPSFCHLCEATIDSDKPSEINYLDVPMLLWVKASFSVPAIFRFAFGHSRWERTVLVIGFMQRLCLTLILFIIFAVAERTFKQRFLYAKLFSHLTSSRRARKSNLPHFRLNKVRNIKTWLSVRSYLKKRGPQRSVDVIVSAAFIVTLLLLAFLSVEWLKDSVHLHSHLNLEALMWSTTIGIFLLRFMTLGNKIHHKYRSVSVLITEQINLYLQIEQKPKKKDELMVSNSVLKLAADLLKELESPFKISGLSANPYLFTTIKVVILSALSGVLSEMLGFKLKLHKIKIK